MLRFDLRLEGKAPTGTYWFKAKERYDVVIYADGTARCTCTAGTFKLSGKNQSNCKHVIESKKLWKALNEKREKNAKTKTD